MPKATPPLRIALAGLGTVGGSVFRLLQDHADLIEARAGRRVEVVAVSARDKGRERGLDLSSCTWTDKAEDLADLENVDVVAEVIGGADGSARALVESALARGLPVVTANKALLATHGAALAALAESKGVPLLWEAAVAAGVPAVKAMRESLAANRVRRVAGVLNGTCNYIMARMEAEGADYEDVLIDAQMLGYAEADPSFDIDGQDAACKIALLAALAFGVRPTLAGLSVRGIRTVDTADIRFAGELGYAVRLLGLAEQASSGALSGGVEPFLIARDHPLAGAPGAHNAVLVEADPVGRVLFEGPGAGGGATASAIVGDLMDIARASAAGARVPPAFGLPAGDLADAPWESEGTTAACFYMRLTVTDAPGVIVAISAILRDEAISIESFLQHGRDPGGAVSLVITTYEAPRAAMTRAMGVIARLPTVLAPPQVIRILRGA
ncbi:MAG TPA: homoserine dehydrogenase [Rhodospirillaceae bacterium]|jgi:homoserine dehydrogenase|nr:homoserine dehydrogenase [Alphaproteobacteria bacterium]HBH26800.1 homoserine dehydrogenase [Rhodospirillaceae bacterium]